MLKTETIKVEVEITFQYDTSHHSYIDDGVAAATAQDMAIRPTRSIEDGVKLLQVCNREQESYWLIKNDTQR